MRVLLAAVVCAALAAPAAHAHPSYHYAGRCGFESVRQDDVTEASYEGVLTAVVAATDAAGAPAPTAPLTVRCTLRVNGADAGSLTAAGTGTAVGVGPLSFVADEDDHVELCEHVVVAGEAHGECLVSTDTQIPPQEVYDLVDSIIGDLWGPGPSFCDVLVELHRQGVPGVNEQGDVYVAGEPFFDCPPYDIDWG